MARVRQQGIGLALLQPIKLFFYLWLTLVLVCVAGMGLEVFIAHQFRGGVVAGIAQAQATLSQDLQMTHSLRQDAPLPRLAETCARGVYWFFFQLVPFERMMTNAAQLPAHPDLSHYGGDVVTRNHLVYHLQADLYIAMLRAQIIGVRMAILFGAAPLILLAWGIGFIDGLTQRYVRRACAGRESSGMYHRAKFFLFSGLSLGAMVYLLWPVSIRPEWIVLPLAVLTGLSSRVQWTYLKKYL